MDTLLVCSIDGCCGEAKGRGWCMKHYMRWKRKGSPNISGNRATSGEALAWLEGVRLLETDMCINWPFRSQSEGYGTVQYGGKGMGAHRAMCIMVHGEPPAPDLLAVHSCGKGQNGCVNHRHIRWGTRQENADDRVLHRDIGLTDWKNPSKLDREAVRVIRQAQGPAIGVALARRYGVSESTISRVRAGKIWRENNA